MPALLHRLGGLCARRPWTVLLVWLAIAFIVLISVGRIGAETSNDLSLPGTDSQSATDLLAKRFPPQQNGTSPIVVHAPKGKVSDSANKSAIQSSVKAILKQPHVYSATDPFANSEAGLVSKDATTAFIPVLMDIGSGELDPEIAQRVIDAAEPAVKAGMTVDVGGPLGSELSGPDTGSSDVIGILAAMVILTLTFGSIVAMGMPILSAVLGLATALGIVGLAGHVVSIPSVGATLATMIGLGVGIDYALFLVTKHRDQLATGMDVRDSIANSVGTAGNAIVFAGGTVVIALLSLGVAGIPFVSALGVACAIAVLVAVLAAVSLLPALLGVVGAHVNALSLPAFMRPKAKPEHRRVWWRWGGFVTRHPWICGGVAVALMVPLIIPMFSLVLGQEDIGVTPTSTTERRAFDQITTSFGPGYNGPLLIASELNPVATPSDEYTEQYDEAMALKKQLTAEQTSLTNQANALKAQQAELESEQADLLAQEADLKSESTSLQKQEDALRAERATLVKQKDALEAQGRELAADLKDLEAALAKNLAEQKVVQAAIDAAVDPIVVDQLVAKLAGLQATEGTLRSRIADTKAKLKTVGAEAKDLAKQAESLAKQAASLKKQADALNTQANELKEQGAALQDQADDLQKQADSLKQQQADAQAQQKQAEALQSELTKELTAAGGDPRGTDPRLVKLQNALIAVGPKGGVAKVSPPRINESGNASTFSVIATTRPADPATAELVTDLRSNVIPPAISEKGISAYVGGSTAANVDLADKISSKLGLVILTVIGLSFLLLLIAFRSLLIPVQAAITNILSVGAAFGVLTAVFQWGWGLSFIGLDSPYGTVPIASYVPLMMFAALFGLSMDYEVFFVSQVQHFHARGEATRDAVHHGLAATAKVIVAAALIMMSVFGSFIINGDPIVKQFGVGLTVAVFLAGFMVLALAPAMLTLFGSATFWIPRWLGFLPHMDIEGGGDDRIAPTASARESGDLSPTV